MGLFSKLLNPKTALRGLVDPAGATISAVTGSSGAESWIDPSGQILRSGSPEESGFQPETTAAADPMANYYGDPNDPQYGSLLDPFDVEQFYQYQDPGYWFRLQQGNQALQNSAAAGSGALSGAALKDLMTFGQDSASQEYTNAFNRYQAQQGNIFSRLKDIALLGQNAAANVGAQGTSLAGNAGQAAWQGGSAAGAGIVGAGNALGQGATNMWLYNNPQMWKGGAPTGGV